MEQIKIQFYIPREHAISQGRVTHGTFTYEPSDLQFRDLTEEERGFIVSQSSPIDTPSENWEDCVKAIKTAHQKHLEQAAVNAVKEEERKLRDAKFQEERRVAQERERQAREQKATEEAAFESTVREWAAGHGEDGLDLAAKNGYPVIERTFKQIVAMVEKALAVTLPIIPYDDWSDCEDHSAPNEKAFEWYGKLVETCQAVAAVLPPFVSLEVDPKIQRIEMSDEDGGKITGGVAILSMRAARRAIAFSFE
jgi:hypothetical protein